MVSNGGRRIRYALTVIAGFAAMLLVPSVSSAASIVFLKGGNVWLAAADGSHQRPVTTGGNWGSPSQADDGTIMAPEGTHLVRLDRSGNPVAEIPTVFTNNPYAIGPGAGAISPDGAHQAYYGELLTSPFCDPVCVQNDTFSAWWGSATTYSQPNQTIGQEDYVDPGWIDNSHLVLAASGILIDELATYTLGGGDNSEVQWFSDPELRGALLGSPTITRAGDKLAVIASVNGGLRNEIRLYQMAGPPPEAPGDPANVPTVECYLGPNNFTTYRLSFSPDGQSLAWDAPDGIHLLTLTGWPNCDGITDQLIIPGGSDPYFGPADVGTGGGSTGGGGGGGHGGGGGGGGSSSGPAGGGGANGGVGHSISNQFSVTSAAAHGGVITVTLSAGDDGVFTAHAAFQAWSGRRGAARRRRSSGNYGSGSARLRQGGLVKLTITPTRRAARTLAQTGRLVVSITITFTPIGATPRVKHLSVSVTERRR